MTTITAPVDATAHRDWCDRTCLRPDNGEVIHSAKIGEIRGVLVEIERVGSPEGWASPAYMKVSGYGECELFPRNTRALRAIIAVAEELVNEINAAEPASWAGADS